MNEQARKAEGDRIRTAREQAGLSQEELAAKAGGSTNTIGSIEAGNKRTQPGKLTAVREALGLPTLVVAQEEEGFPPDVKIVRDAIGMWLLKYPPESRADYVARLLRAIVNGD